MTMKVWHSSFWFYSKLPRLPSTANSGERILWFTVRGFRFFFFSIFSHITETIGLKFGHNVWIGPEGVR